MEGMTKPKNFFFKGVILTPPRIIQFSLYVYNSTYKAIIEDFSQICKRFTQFRQPYIRQIYRFLTAKIRSSSIEYKSLISNVQMDIKRAVVDYLTLDKIKKASNKGGTLIFLWTCKR